MHTSRTEQSSRLRICIDPWLTGKHGPEVHWVWRLLLTAIGHAWEEVPLGQECDVAYVVDPSYASTPRLCIIADPGAWDSPALHRLEGVNRRGELVHPVFQTQMSRTDRVCVRDGGVTCRRDIVFDVFWLVTGQEEQHWPKDRHGFFDLTGTAVLSQQVLRQALASQIIAWLENTLLDLGCAPPVPRWPGGKRAAASVSHDVDYPEVKRWIEPLRILRRQGTSGLGAAWDIVVGRRSHWQFPAWVDMDKRLRTPSAFYFVARQGSLMEYLAGMPDPFYDVTSERFRDLFRYLEDEGFEIGLHASYAACRSWEVFATEKRQLEEACGQPVLGNRHHYWHLNPNDVEQTLLIHEQIGLRYDASLIHNRYVGWRRGLSHPYFPFHQAERRELCTLQIPSAWMDDQLFGLRAYNPGDRDGILRGLADCVAEQGGCLLVDVHDYVFDEVLFPGWARTYRRLWEYLLDRGDFWMAAPGEIATHWIARYTSLVRNSRGLGQGNLQYENDPVRVDSGQPTFLQDTAPALVLPRQDRAASQDRVAICGDRPTGHVGRPLLRSPLYADQVGW